MKFHVSCPLYPKVNERTVDSNTTAIKELVEAANKIKHCTDSVIQFKRIINKGKIVFPSRSRNGSLDLYSIPKIGIREFYSKKIMNITLDCLGYPYDADVLISHFVAGFSFAREYFGNRYRKYILVLHCSDLFHPLLTSSIKRADVVLTFSFAVKNQLKKLYGYDAKGVIFPGVDEALYVSSSSLIDPEPLNIVIPSFFISRKNIEPTLEGVKLCSKYVNVLVDLFGDGPLKGKIIETIHRLELQDKVFIHGFRPRSEVMKAMRNSHLLVLPSIRETLGQVYFEAMSQGCVVIGHEGWGIDGIVEDGINGFLVKEATPVLIADKILEYLKCNRKKVHDTSYETIKEFTLEKTAKNYLDLLKTV